MSLLPFMDDGASYPDAPGFKAQSTSFAAAVGMAPKAGTLRERVLAAIRLKPGTPEEIAKRLHEPVMNIRPRCSELLAKGLIANSGLTREAMGGRQAIVWQAAAKPPEGATQ